MLIGACDIKMYNEGSRKYVGALTKLRNKVTWKVYGTLNNHGTALSF